MKRKDPIEDSGTGGLDALLMHTGSLDEILKGTQWNEIAGVLKRVYLTYMKQTVPLAEQATYVANLFVVYYAPSDNGMLRVVRCLDDARYLQAAERKAIVDFLEAFILANGQLRYISQQEWFTSRDYVIGIDVNYYPDRSGFNPASPKFHKDTGGNNIFVNLIFDNPQPIEATEWFVDTEQPSTARKRWQEKLLPASHLKELDRVRQASW